MISNTHTVEPDYSPALDFKGAFPTRDINRSSQNGVTDSSERVGRQ